MGRNRKSSREIVRCICDTMRGPVSCPAPHRCLASQRCVELGVRCIEHGTLIDDDTAAFVAAVGAYVVPAMAIIFAMSEHGRKHNLPDLVLAKIDEVIGNALQGMHRMRAAQVKLGFGTDLVGHTYIQQCREFLFRREVFTALEILRQATSIGAEVLQLQGRLGCIAADAHADIIVVDGDPLQGYRLAVRRRSQTVADHASRRDREELLRLMGSPAAGVLWAMFD